MTEPTQRPAPLLSSTFPNFGTFVPASAYSELADLGRAAEDTGLDRLVVVDHVVMSENVGAYQWGTFPGGPDGPWLEPLTVLAAVAATTRRIRLATGVVIAALRPAALLAKTTATLDAISAGRLDLGVGTGWQREEYEAVGLLWSERGRLLDETLEICSALWQGGPVSYRTERIELDRLYCVPRPVSPDGVPVWIAGSLHARNLNRLRRWATGWIPIMGTDLDGFTAGIATLRAEWQLAGRDPSTLQSQANIPVVRNRHGVPDLARTIGGAGAWADAGATAINITVQAFAADPSAAPAVWSEAARRFASETSHLS
jgi:probable F420-dependent oxidoreductase